MIARRLHYVKTYRVLSTRPNPRMAAADYALPVFGELDQLPRNATVKLEFYPYNESIYVTIINGQVLN